MNPTLKLITAEQLEMHFEQFSERAYRDPGGVWTLGWGYTGLFRGFPIDALTRITRIEADNLLAAHTIVTRDQVRRLTRLVLGLSTQQIEVLTSLAYNVGIGNFENSQLLQFLHEGRFLDAAQQILQWDHVAHHVLAGLLKRRCVECALFLGEQSFVFIQPPEGVLA